jgi:hypothetical protein
VEEDVGSHHEGEDAEVDEEGEQKHTHGAHDVIQECYLLPGVEEHLVEAPKVHCTDRGQDLEDTKVDDKMNTCAKSRVKHQNMTQSPGGRQQREAQRTNELVRGDLFEDGAEVVEGVLAGANGEQEDEEHRHPHRPCHQHRVPEGIICLGYRVCIAGCLLKASVVS